MEASSRTSRHGTKRSDHRRGPRATGHGRAASSSADASDAGSLGAQDSLEVTFCRVERVAGRVYLAVCTSTLWRLYRLDGFVAARDSCTPVQLTMDPQKALAQLQRVRFFRLYQLPPVSTSLALGAVFVTERTAQEATASSDDEDEDDFVTTTHELSGDDDPDRGREDLTVISLDEERVLHKLPPSPSLVLDVQTNASVAAVLCETRELFLYDLATFQLRQCITTASPAMALGARWLAYPGVVPDVTSGHSTAGTVPGDSDPEDDSDPDDDGVPIEALVGGSPACEPHSAPYGTSPSYTAIDVAQNVASGLYYLSEMGRATIAPYLASSPGQQSPPHIHTQGAARSRRSSRSGSSPVTATRSARAARRASSSSSKEASASKQHPGWVIVQDLTTQRVVANFPCHSTALVNLSLDFSGLMLATSSTKGQNLHVYRLSPPLQTIVNGKAGAGHSGIRHQLLYKLQRGITHASIQDLAFSQDGKWINVTSAHGTSHLYALHPEGARVSADTHANAVESADVSMDEELGPGFPRREVNDFYADFRTLETRTQTQVLRIRHELKLPNTASTAQPVSSSVPVTRSSSSSSNSSLSSTGSSSSPSYNSPPAMGSSSRGNTIMESALDASQALLSQLATSAIDFGHQHFEHGMDVEARRRRLHRRLSSLFAQDGPKMLICCDAVLKLYGMRVTALSKHKADHARASSSPAKTKNSKSSLSSFGFEASVTELKTWELFSSTRRKTEPLSSAARIRTSSSSSSSSLSARHSGSSGEPFVTDAKTSAKSELRTFAQRSLPLWAHPKVTFKAIDAEHPTGKVLEVKRKGPNPSQDLSASAMALAPEGFVNGDEQLFVMEMDSYFGIGGSPVFDGRNAGHSSAPEMPPPLDLQESINLAMSTSVPATPPRTIPEMNNTLCLGPVQQESSLEVSDSGDKTSRKSKKKKGKSRRVSTPPSPPMQPESSGAETEISVDGSTNGGLQFTLQDMYFGVPSAEEASS